MGQLGVLLKGELSEGEGGQSLGTVLYLILSISLMLPSGMYVNEVFSAEQCKQVPLFIYV